MDCKWSTPSKEGLKSIPITVVFVQVFQVMPVFRHDRFSISGQRSYFQATRLILAIEELQPYPNYRIPVLGKFGYAL